MKCEFVSPEIDVTVTGNTIAIASQGEAASQTKDPLNTDMCTDRYGHSPWSLSLHNSLTLWS
jgi:hypothetical protein